MTPSPVHILATVRKPELLEAALLSFRTLRVGFPHNEVVVWGNGLEERDAVIVGARAAKAGARFANVPKTSHDAWIEALVERAAAPFWIADTDLVFWQEMEAPPADALFSGRLEPEFLEEWTHTTHLERLHTCLMWFNPSALRAVLRSLMARVPHPFRNTAQFPALRQYFVAQRNGPTMFYDSTAGLWHFGMGTPFSEAQNDSFDHLHCATYVDLIGPGLTGVNDLQRTHQRIYAQPELARGIRHEQNVYYASRAAGQPGILPHDIYRSGMML